MANRTRAAYAKKFAVFLINNNHLEHFSIEKTHAKEIYNNVFKKNHNNLKLGFGTIFHLSLSLLKKQKDHNLMVFKENKLMNLRKHEAKIDNLILNKGKGKQSNRNQVRSVETLPSQTERQSSSRGHLSKQALSPLKKLSDLEFTLDGTSNLDNIVLRQAVPKTVVLTVKNTTKHPIKIVSVETKSEVKEIEFKPACPHDLAPTDSIQYTLIVHSDHEGIIYFPVLFKTEVNNNAQDYSTQLIFHTHSQFFDDLHPVEPYIGRSRRVLKEYIEEIDQGERPNIFPKLPMKIRLEQYLLPIELEVVLNTGLKPFNGITQPQKTQLANVKSLLDMENKSNCLNPSNYTKLLDLLLFIEEHQMYKDIRNYDREDQILKPAGGGLLELEVPGLAEHRPSVIFADSVFVRENKNSKILFEGFVHKVKESSVLLKFSKRFLDTVFIKNKKFYVHFTFNRYPLRVEHQAVKFTKSDNITHFMFPNKITDSPLEKSKISWINRDIENNPQQQQAVQCILQRTAMPAPYLIFGPPGTGKTMTVVESVKQIYKLTNHRILICTPSNNAANEVTKRLVGTIPTTDLFRFIAPSFPYQLIPSALKKYINYHGGNYYQPTMEEFSKYRVLITTLVSAAKLVNGGCPSGHFGYLFIDESGQATETETLIPVARILSSGTKPGTLSGQLVLAGDPWQLGPVIHSGLALEYGFGISMLERLINSEPYKKDESKKYNANALTKLLKNYRSHPSIMVPSNELFYENELQSAGDNLINAAINWEHLPNPQFPLIFHSVIGIDQREKSSPSFFNIQEIQLVLHYLEVLKGSKMQGLTIKEEHIGIITPYKKQADKIKQACKNKNYNEKLMIGTVEQIQGQERLIIIISTVRSKVEFLKFDKKFHLGFLSNPKRFNVAITRAKALLIIIGNPNILQHDKYWRNLISYCKDNNAMKGVKFELSDCEEKEVASIGISLAEINLEEAPSFVRGTL